jgi:hypothetical protein
MTDQQRRQNCNANQVYDLYVQKCISCRDPNSTPIMTLPSGVQPTANFLNSDGRPTVTNTNGRDSTPARYRCENSPIKTYDQNNNILSLTCDSGEELLGGRCVINFLGNNN